MGVDNALQGQVVGADCPASHTYHDRCRAWGETHTQAVLRLAHHRISALFTMLRDGTSLA